MKHTLLLLTLLMMLTGCEKRQEGLELREAYGYHVVLLDGCEYIENVRTNAVFTHKGNCKNPIHKTH